MLNWLLVLFAGSYAQAFETRRSLARTVPTGLNVPDTGLRG
jgi:hypothetical protein